MLLWLKTPVYKETKDSLAYKDGVWREVPVFRTTAHCPEGPSTKYGACLQHSYYDLTYVLRDNDGDWARLEKNVNLVTKAI